MRDRGKRKYNGEWVYGYLIGNDVIVGEIVEFSDECFNCEYWWRVDPRTVGQSTGRKDKNGKEIYKGDIVKYVLYRGGNEIIGVVRLGVYEQDGSGGEYGPTKCLGFYIERIKTILDDWEIKYGWKPNEPEYEKTISLLEPKWVEVIGNEFENPELLKGEEMA